MLTTAGACLLGGILQNLISERTINILGGILFLIFGLLTTLEGNIWLPLVGECSGSSFSL